MLKYSLVVHEFITFFLDSFHDLAMKLLFLFKEVKEKCYKIKEVKRT
jgi:hypothetical protein